MTAVVTAIKDVNPTSTNAPKRRMGPEQAEARPSQATRSSPISNDAVPSCSTPPSILAPAHPSWDRKHTSACGLCMSARWLRQLVSTPDSQACQLLAVLASPGPLRRTAPEAIGPYAVGGAPRRLS